MRLLKILKNRSCLRFIKNRIKHTLLIVVVLFTLLFLIITANDPKPNWSFINLWESQSRSLSISEEKYGVYAKIFEVLAEANPGIEPLSSRYVRDNQDIMKFPNDEAKMNEKYLSNLLPLNNKEKLSMFKSYETFLNGIEKLQIPVFGNEMKQRIEGSGIVIVGGEKFSWLALLNIHQLRKTGSKLPVEIYIPSEEEYDRAFCEDILPDLNARCILGFQEFPQNQIRRYFHLNKFEHKIMAILSSSFEDVLLLDADNVVTDRPDALFDWKVYKEKQLILWPDCWVRTTNPFLYDLFRIEVDYSGVTEDDFDFHNLPGAIPNPSTESGMLLVNKRSQVSTLLLSLYLNLYGFDYYYPLITQGSAGEGDKDTYIVAAYALKQPVYQVKQGVQFLGRLYKGEFYSSGLGQCNPMTVNEELAASHEAASKCEDYLFIHLSHPKFYPDEITKNYISKADDTHFPQFDKLQVDYYFELQMWEIMAQLLCKKYEPANKKFDNPASQLLDPKYKLSGLELSYVRKLDMDLYCEKEILPHLEYLREYFSQS